MGTFHTACRVENITDGLRRIRVPELLVDRGSEFTWISSAQLNRIGIKREKKDMPFIMANGQTATRSVGFAIIRVGKHFTIDEVVFAEPGDLALLGARTLEGLNLVVYAAHKRLLATGPLPAA